LPASAAAAAAGTTTTTHPVDTHIKQYECGVGGNYRQSDIDFSLCGGLDEPGAFSRTLFESGKLSFDDFAERLKIRQLNLFTNPNLVVRIGDQYFTWESACPIIMSRVLYGRSLPSELVDVIAAAVTAVPTVVTEPTVSKPVAVVQPQTPVPAVGAEPAIVGMPVSQIAVENANPTENAETASPLSSAVPQTPPNTADVSLQQVDQAAAVEPESSKRSSWFGFFGSKSGSDSASTSPQKSGGNPGTVSNPDCKNGERDLESGQPDPNMLGGSLSNAVPGSASRNRSRTPNESTSSECSTTEEFMAQIAGQKAKTYKKTLRLSTDLIKKLNLKSGSNEVQFSVTTAFQGTTRCNCHVYLWKWTDKIVISDIDGTITKSDVLGHVLPIIGRDWAQSGVASLFTKIRNNGYHIAYLSARAIGQAPTTKDYLQSVSQEDLNLPDGPLLLNPTSLVNAFHREVIIKKPEEFKIACLRDIQKLFPDFDSEDGNPFYAGYGNRVNDVWAYTAVQIQVSRIFTINPKGELRHALTQAYRASYSSQSEMVDHIFPPRNCGVQHLEPLNNYSSFSYWQEPLPAFDIEDEIAKMTGATSGGVEGKKDTNDSTKDAAKK